MAGSKKVNQQQIPMGNTIPDINNPVQYYAQRPSWNFSSCDKEYWSLYSDDVRKMFWTEILPHFQGWETQSWSDILVVAKKQNHSIDVNLLNKIAADRLVQLYIEAESLISLRLTSTHRVYSYMNGAVFNVLWIDLNHGDNKTCVCRSSKKHT